MIRKLNMTTALLPIDSVPHGATPDAPARDNDNNCRDQTNDALHDELRAWLQLAHTKGLRPLALRQLLGKFGGPLDVLAESLASLAQVAGKEAAHAVLAAPADIEGVCFDDYMLRARVTCATCSSRSRMRRTRKPF